MMTNKDKLKSLIDIVADLLQIEENEWMVDDLLNIIQDKIPPGEISNHPVIEKINEYCIEEKIKKQAEDFYEDFALEEIKEQLIEDYVKMEHERRRDDFHGFCLCMFQQIEAVVNYCFESEDLTAKLKRDKNQAAFVKWDSKSRVWHKEDSNDLSTQLLVPYLLKKVNTLYRSKESPEVVSGQPYYKVDSIDKYFESDGYPVIELESSGSKWSFPARIRTVLYYYFFNEELKSRDMDPIYEVAEELQVVRNKNHREGKAYPFQQLILNRIKGKESKYYFRFYGFLFEFISTVNENLSGLTGPKRRTTRASANKYTPQKELKVLGKIDLSNLPKK